MIVYTNKDGSEFKSVSNDVNNYATYDEYQFLKEDGFHFYPNFDLKSAQADDDDLIAIINSMPLKNQIELANEVYHMQNSGDSEPYVDPNGLDDLKREYQEEYDDPVSQKDFEHELITGEDGILDSLNDVYSDGLTWREMSYVMTYLDQHIDPNKWHSWQINGYNQGDVSFVWVYNEKKLPIDPDEKLIDDKESNYFGDSWNEYLTTILYGSTCEISDCDKYGNIADSNSRYVVSYEFNEDEYANDSHSTDLDDYMWKTYHMKLARIHIVYEAYEEE